jgi:hypothetical protein
MITQQRWRRRSRQTWTSPPAPTSCYIHSTVGRTSLCVFSGDFSLIELLECGGERFSSEAYYWLDMYVSSCFHWLIDWASLRSIDWLIDLGDRLSKRAGDWLIDLGDSRCFYRLFFLSFAVYLRCWSICRQILGYGGRKIYFWVKKLSMVRFIWTQGITSNLSVIQFGHFHLAGKFNYNITVLGGGGVNMRNSSWFQEIFLLSVYFLEPS